MSELKDITYLTKVELAKRWKVRTRTIENWVKDGKIPAPLKISPRKALWSLEDIIAHEMKQREEAGMTT